ncbi:MULTISPECIES: hypothetical protein [unclassified Helicobacter]|nr:MULTISPECIES: hypothetical protein [unclassified Helicobacter]
MRVFARARFWQNLASLAKSSKNLAKLAEYRRIQHLTKPRQPRANLAQF